MNSEHLAESIKRFGEVIALPESAVEAVELRIEDWRVAQAGFAAASKMIRKAEGLMHESIQLAIPELKAWQYSFDAAKHQVTLLGREEDKLGV